VACKVQSESLAVLLFGSPGPHANCVQPQRTASVCNISSKEWAGARAARSGEIRSVSVTAEVGKEEREHRGAPRGHPLAPQVPLQPCLVTCGVPVRSRWLTEGQESPRPCAFRHAWLCFRGRAASCSTCGAWHAASAACAHDLVGKG